MNDLEPYICTFGSCLRTNKTYGLKADWIHHEIDIHQTQKVWFCRPCEAELESRQAFDNHMRQNHPGLVNEHQLDSFAELCTQISPNLEKRTLCPLCLADFKKEKLLRNHLADELEQIALFAALPARPRLYDPNSDDELDLMEDSDTDGESRAESMGLEASEGSRTQAEARDAAVKQFLGSKADSTSKEGAQDSAEVIESLDGPAVLRTSTAQFPVLTIKHPPNESFYGREEAILKIHQKLDIPGDICIIYGVGGVGKTLTTVEYAYRYKQAYDCIFWLQADTAPGLAESYGDIALTLGLVHGSEDQGRIVDLARDWMENTSKMMHLFGQTSLMLTKDGDGCSFSITWKTGTSYCNTSPTTSTIAVVALSLSPLKILI